MRRLMSTRRRIPLDRTEDYAALWSAVRDAAEAVGVHAWRFRAKDRDDIYMEFLEASDPEPLADTGLGAARDALDRAFVPERSDEWEEAP